ncbi:MAG TPA: hypothetical protein VMC08_09540 [Bacteroidales bacterium]|nr:hypothetical protein [Bacteroidales bacterium]
MRCLKPAVLFLMFLPLLYACNKDLNVNADWQEITVVYGLLNQSDSVHDIKITKAFLGPGNALDFAKIADSSNFPDPLDVTMEEWSGSTLVKTFTFDTVTIHDKEAGDSIFYFPDQLVYRTVGNMGVGDTYKLFIRNPRTGSEVTSQTTLIHPFAIDKPQSYTKVTYEPGKNTVVEWDPAVNGRRYQLEIRFHYLEFPVGDTTAANKKDKYVNWLVFSDVESATLNPPPGASTMKYNIPGDAFYVVLGGNIPVDPNVSRTARDVEYIFSVASDDLNTYMEVTEPSNTIVQERPTFTNITNGIGLFASRYNNRKDNPLVLQLGQITLDELKVNENTKNLGF